MGLDLPDCHPRWCVLLLNHEMKYAEHVSVVGDGQCRHTILHCFAIKLFDGRSNRPAGELGVVMEVRELHYAIRVSEWLK